MLLNHDKRHSTTVIIAVTLFLFFDFTALAANFWMSWKIDQNAIAINLAGRQRMLSQRMVKTLLQIEEAQRLGVDPAANLSELKLTFDLFDNTLQGFSKGHETRGGAGEILFLDSIKEKTAKQMVNQAGLIWQPYRNHVQAVINGGYSGLSVNLPPALKHAKQDNLELLNLMNGLTTELETLTQYEARIIRILQASLALINLFWVTWFYWWRVQAFNRRHGLVDSMMNKASASMLVLDDAGVVIQANQTAETMFGYKRDALVGCRMNALVQESEGNQIGHRLDGTTFFAQVTRNEAVLDERKLSIATVFDITQHHRSEERLAELAYHDPLTRLPNRLLFDDRLRLEITHSQRRNLMLAVLFVDLDYFKPVNDTHGHEVGDLLLQEAAVRLKRCLRESDTVSRRGGDEFTVIVTDIDSHQHCEKIAEMILSQLTLSFHIENLELHIGASIGISLFPKDGVEALELVNRADEAMYQAKQAGRGTYRFYSS